MDNDRRTYADTNTSQPGDSASPKNPKDRARHEHSGSHSGTRRFNGILAAFLSCFFLIHAGLGCITGIAPLSNRLAFLVWLGVGVLLVHVIASIVTTYFMYTDTERPPSNRKKRHQVLKWITGAVLLVLAAIHVAVNGGSAALRDPVSLIILLLLVVAIAVHSYTGIKSLTRDLDLPKNTRTPFRIALIVAAVLVGTLALFAFCA